MVEMEFKPKSITSQKSISFLQISPPLFSRKSGSLYYITVINYLSHLEEKVQDCKWYSLGRCKEKSSVFMLLVRTTQGLWSSDTNTIIQKCYTARHMKSTVLFVWFLLSILKKCAVICTLLFSRPEVRIGQRLLNNQDCYCSFHPSNSLIIVAFWLTFIQSLWWICKGEVIEKDFKSLRLDINTVTELNELEKKKSQFLSCI